MSFHVHKNLNDARLQKDNNQQTFLALEPTFLRFRQNKKIATYNVKLSTTFVLNILFSDDFLRVRGEFLQRNLHQFRDVFKIQLLSTFLSGIPLSLDSCNKKRTKPVLYRDIEHLSKVDFCMPIFKQYLLISWIWLVLSNSINILRLLTKLHPWKLTLKDFTGLSILQISVQNLESMQICLGSNCTFF